MRVISGFVKGKKLLSSKDKTIRPTTDKVKMAIFNVLEHGKINFSLNNTNILDLFSGSGSLGIESLSRGAAHCLFIDRSKESHAICLKNLENCNLLEKAQNIIFDISQKKKFLSKKKFDLIIADPPYNKDYIKNIFGFITKNNLIVKNGLVVIEEDKKAIIEVEENFELLDKRIYGSSQVLFFQYRLDPLK
ncbi:MAG: 16S rRNA (guanine(966)-N(2))-methyltransferase RsmD [Hyphomicrobiales bacterium]|nr:16S rRNA (guanine(966)-N(2))-methyltransferase RsmD [Hyphomicrobiales bacterium]|tara:strand:+ start:180 stop:752 length:573 start_codon:yes stop_codon:yes gene_type:complete